MAVYIHKFRKKIYVSFIKVGVMSSPPILGSHSLCVVDLILTVYIKG